MAAKDIGIDLALCASHPNVVQIAKHPASAASKAEYTFRWLMKSLKEDKEFRVLPTSFLLLQQLIDLIYPRKLSILLEGADFLSVLTDVLADLEEAVFAGFEDDAAGLPRSSSESSHTAASSPSQNGSDKKGTKRKRPSGNENGSAMETDDEPQTPTSPMLAFLYLLDCLYCLMVLATETLEDDDASRLRLTQALRYELESGAIMLARSFSIAAMAASDFSQQRMTTQFQHLMYVLPALFAMWKLRSANEDGSASAESNVGVA